MSGRSRSRLRATALIAAPVVMLAGFLYHPHIGDPTDPGFLERLGEAVAADPTRWAVAHLLVAVGSGLTILAFLALRVELQRAGEERWSAPAVPFVVMGSTLYALLPAFEFAPLAAAWTGGDAAAAQGALMPWFVPTLFTSAGLFVIGVIGFALAVVRTGILGAPSARFVAAALLVMAACRLVPLNLVQLHLQGLAGLAGFVPLAIVVWRRAPIDGEPIASAQPGTTAMASP